MIEPPGLHDYILRKSLQPYSPKNEYMVISPSLSKNLSLYYIKQAALKRAQAKEKLTINDFFKQKNRIPKPLNLERFIPKTDRISLKPRVPVLIKKQNEEELNEQKFRFDPRTDYAAKRSYNDPERLSVSKRLKQLLLEVIPDQEIDEIVSTYRRMLISGEVRAIYLKQGKNEILQYGMNSSDNPLDLNQKYNLDNQKEQRQLQIFKELAKRYNLNILDRLHSLVKLQLHEIFDPQLLKTEGNQSSDDLEDEKFQLIQERVKDNLQLKQLQLIEGLSELTSNRRIYGRRSTTKAIDINNKFIPILKQDDIKIMNTQMDQTKSLTSILSTKFQSRRESSHLNTAPNSLQCSPNQTLSKTLFKSERNISHFKHMSNNNIPIISNSWIRIQKDARQLKQESDRKKQQLIENKRFNKQMGLNFNRFIGIDNEFEDETKTYREFKKQITTNIQQIMTNRAEELQDLIQEEEQNNKYLSQEHKINRINILIKRRLLNFMVNQLQKNDQFILLNNITLNRNIIIKKKL